MATIPPTTHLAGNPQLAGITSTIPQTRGPAPTLADGSPYTFSLGEVTLGGPSAPAYTVSAGEGFAPHAAAAVANASGGGAALNNGAQPAAPGSADAVATPVTGSTPATTESTPAVGAPSNDALAAVVSGYGKGERGKPMVAAVDGAKFSFPSFNKSAKSTAAPAITWGPGWKKVEKNGMWYMQHANGTKAIPATEFRITPTPADKVQTIKVANGWGKKFPDGSIVVFDRTEGAYRLDAKGVKHQLPLGNQTIGGVKVRVFEAAVVRTLEPSGAVTVFTSRGQTNAGSKRGAIAAAVGAAGGGAAMVSKPTTVAQGSPTQGGGTVAQGSPTQVGGSVTQGGGAVVPTTAQLAQHIGTLTAAARQLLEQVQSGTVDPAKLAALQAQLSALPSGLGQAVGAAGTMVATPLHADHTAAIATPATTPGATVAAGGASTQPPLPAGVAGAASATTNATTAVGGASGGGATVAAAATPARPAGATPVAGNDVQANAVKTLAAGTKMTVAAGVVPADLTGKQARFAQLPADVQMAIAKAVGSDQGAAAFEADTLFSFAANGAVTLVEGDKAYMKHVQQIRGAGPGEDLALTVKPTRQPGAKFAATGATSISGGGAATSAAVAKPKPAAAAVSKPATATSAHTGAAHASAIGGGASIPANATRISVFGAGNTLRAPAFAGNDGAFTWKSLPAAAKTAILDWLNTHPSSAAGANFGARPGTGWMIDPSQQIVLTNGVASFVNGLDIMKATVAAPAPYAPAGMPPVSGGGPSSTAPSHNAHRPPVTGGGGPAGVNPANQPPVPTVADPGEHAGMVM